MRTVALLLCLLPMSCGLALPELPDDPSAEARAADYPALVPLGPLLANTRAPLPRTAAQEGTTLEARAEALRRRAARLRAMQL